ncbi:hypothetical protein CK203_076803 [Vitis vinifera]|uniref:Uncharacterized protein n=1 Tax=Vitis vinifera TaxID=29760 RepID=A0A438ET23_VITVI|nr:hypothetical protein CK203_076803 [Vitis vinifera]
MQCAICSRKRSETWNTCESDTDSYKLGQCLVLSLDIQGLLAGNYMANPQTRKVADLETNKVRITSSYREQFSRPDTSRFSKEQLEHLYKLLHQTRSSQTLIPTSSHAKKGSPLSALTPLKHSIPWIIDSVHLIT